MNKYQSSEDYLERILMLSTKTTIVRAIDIANSLDYTKASVSIALKKLKNQKYITVNEATGAISLTSSGAIIAKNIYERHQIISKGLIALGVSEDIALEDACKIEHDLSDESFAKIKEYLQNNFKH